MIVRCLRPYARSIAPPRNRVRVRVERRLGDRSADIPRPPAGTDALVRIRFLHHVVGAVWNPTGKGGSGTARESRARQVESAPPEMRWARFPDEAAPELLQHSIGLRESKKASMRGFRIIGCVGAILIESHGVGHLHRYRKDLHFNSERAQHR